MSEIDWDRVDDESIRIPVMDVRIDDIRVNPAEGIIRWSAGAEMTNMSGSAVLQHGYWIVHLDFGDTYRLYDLRGLERWDNVIYSNWMGGKRGPNTRTILALREILRRVSGVEMS